MCKRRESDRQIEKKKQEAMIIMKSIAIPRALINLSYPTLSVQDFTKKANDGLKKGRKERKSPSFSPQS